MPTISEPEQMATLAQLQRDFVARFNRAAGPFGGRITSYWRTPARNRAVGGAPNSQHLYGLAVDIVPARGERTALKAALRNAGLVVIDEGDHVHVQRLRAGSLSGYLA